VAGENETPPLFDTATPLVPVAAMISFPEEKTGKAGRRPNPLLLKVTPWSVLTSRPVSVPAKTCDASGVRT